MSLPVHLVESLAGVDAGDPVAVTGDEAHHAVAVRRLRVGERVQLTDGAGYPNKPTSLIGAWPFVEGITWAKSWNLQINPARIASEALSSLLIVPIP